MKFGNLKGKIAGAPKVQAAEVVSPEFHGEVENEVADISRDISPPAPAQDTFDEKAGQLSIILRNFERKHPLSSLKPGQVYEVPLALIDENPRNARHFFNPKSLETLAVSLKETQEQIPQAFLNGNRFVLLDGARRLKAKKAADELASMKICLAYPIKDHLTLYFRSRSANLSEPLTIYDDALGFQELIEKEKLKQDQISERLIQAGETKYNQPYISRLLRLSKLPPELFQLMASIEHFQKERIATSLAAELLKAIELDIEHGKLKSLIEEVAAKGLSYKAIEEFCPTWVASNLPNLNTPIKEKKAKPHSKATAVVFGKSAGTIKYFANRQEFNLNLKNVSAEQYKTLRERLFEFMEEEAGAGEGVHK